MCLMSHVAHDRANVPIAPPGYDIDRLPSPLVEDGTPVTLEAAGEIYGRCIGSRHHNGDPSKVDEHLNRYGRILATDRELQSEFGSLTTVMLTLRISPTIDDFRIHPLTLDQWVRESWGATKDALDYRLRGYESEYVVVVASTSRWATPHLHIYMWADDPMNELTADQFRGVIGKHTNACQTAYPEHHPIDPDGQEGAVTVRYDPPRRTAGEDNDHGGPVTSGCRYVAKQLAHLPLSNDDPATDVELQAGALAWASPNPWVWSSRGVKLRRTMG